MTDLNLAAQINFIDAAQWTGFLDQIDAASSFHGISQEAELCANVSAGVFQFDFKNGP